MANFSFGLCKRCKKVKALKDGICSECEKDEIDIPDFIKDLFEGFKGFI